MIEFINFKKRFIGAEEDLLDIKNLVLQNKIYWLKGNNGAGKTSLIKSMAGIIPFEGNIFVDGININKHRIKYRLEVN